MPLVRLKHEGKSVKLHFLTPSGKHTEEPMPYFQVGALNISEFHLGLGTYFLSSSCPTGKRWPWRNHFLDPVPEKKKKNQHINFPISKCMFFYFPPPKVWVRDIKGQLPITLDHYAIISCKNLDVNFRTAYNCELGRKVGSD